MYIERYRKTSSEENSHKMRQALTVQWLAIKLAVSILTIRKLAVVFLSFQIQKLLIDMVWKKFLRLLEF